MPELLDKLEKKTGKFLRRTLKNFTNTIAHGYLKRSNMLLADTSYLTGLIQRHNCRVSTKTF